MLMQVENQRGHKLCMMMMIMVLVTL